MNTSNNLPINHRATWTNKETKQLIKEVFIKEPSMVLKLN